MDSFDFNLATFNEQFSDRKNQKSLNFYSFLHYYENPDQSNHCFTAKQF